MLHRLIDHSLAFFAYPVGAFFVTLDINARWLSALRTNQHDVRNVELSLELNATGIDLASCLGLDLLLVFDANIDTLHDYTALVRQNVNHFTALSFIFEAPADNFNSIAFANLNSHSFTLPRWPKALPEPAKRSS
jgi:hypothetical protein